MLLPLSPHHKAQFKLRVMLVFLRIFSSACQKNAIFSPQNIPDESNKSKNLIYSDFVLIK